MKKIARRSFLTYATAFGLATSTVLPPVGATQRNSDDEVIDCLLNDDTACVVSVWEKEFEDNRMDDITRQNYFYSLLIHGLRSLDKGHLTDAKSAYQRASEIIPGSNETVYKYLENVSSLFEINLTSEGMDFFGNESHYVDADIERAFVQTRGYLGANTTAMMLTAKSPGRFN